LLSHRSLLRATAPSRLVREQLPLTLRIGVLLGSDVPPKYLDAGRTFLPATRISFCDALMSSRDPNTPSARAFARRQAE
jgi:hypothetical protein